MPSASSASGPPFRLAAKSHSGSAALFAPWADCSSTGECFDSTAATVASAAYLIATEGLPALNFAVLLQQLNSGLKINFGGHS